MSRLKTILLVTGFIIVVIGIGAGLYFAFFRTLVAPTTPTDEPIVTEEQPGIGLPAADEGAPIPVTPEVTTPTSLADAIASGGETQTQVLGTALATNSTASGNNLNYYDPDDGRFYSTDDEGNIVTLSSQQFPEVDSVVWDNNAEKAVIEFPDGSNVVYDFTTDTQVTLPRHWEDFSFSRNGDEIVSKSMAIDPNNRWLVTSNTDGSNVRAVQPLGLNGDKVQVSYSPNNSVIAFADTAAPLAGGFGRKMILPIGKNQENYKGLVVEGLDFQPQWSPDGRKLLYSVAGDVSQSRPLLWVVDATPATMGDNRRSIGLNTWAEKCTFSTSSIAYCAVPNSLPPNAGLQRSIHRNTPDSLYEIDILSGRSTLIASPENNAAMENLSVSGDGATLFFTNITTGQLETMRLK